MTKITESGIFVKKYNIPDFFDRKENTAVLLSQYIRRSSAITENTAALVRMRTDTDRAGEPKKGRVHMEMKAMSTDRNLLLQLKGELDHHSARDMIREGCRESRLTRIVMQKGTMMCGGEITVFLLPV